MFRAAVLIITALAAAAVHPVAAEAQADFTFKRVTPPAKGKRRLIDIHVDPVVPVEPVLSHVPTLPDAPKVVRKGIGAPPVGPTAGWFWRDVSPALASASAERMIPAMQSVDRNAAAMPAPNLDSLAALSARYGADILAATAGTRVSPALVLAVMAVESGGRPAAQSSAGAVGLMQLMPGTALRFGVTDRTDPVQSINGGVRYLAFLLAQFGEDPLLTLAGYNAGEGAVMKSGGVPDYPETRDYVPKVVAAWGKARLLCSTPPMRATDSCMFTGLRIAAQ